MIGAARQRGYFEDSEVAEPLQWLETCNDQVKDCMVALESMLDPQLDELMTSSLQEQQQSGPEATAPRRSRLRSRWKAAPHVNVHFRRRRRR